MFNETKDKQREAEAAVETETEVEAGAETESEQAAAEEATSEGDDSQLKKLEEEIAELRSKLRRANRQAAERRIKLKELTKKDETESDDVSGIQAQLHEAQKRLKRYEMLENLGDVVDQLEVSFTSARARNDALDFALREIDKEFGNEDVQPTEEDYAEAIKKVLKKRPYLLRARKEPPVETDSKKRSKGDEGLMFDEAEIARQFGIKPL